MTGSETTGAAGIKNDAALLRQVVETTPDIVYVLNPDGVIVEANPQLCRLLRQPREKLLGVKITTHLERDYVPLAERVLMEIVERRAPQRSTRTYRVAGAEPQTYEVMESPLLRE